MTKVEIPQLTGMRFLAAFSILILHSVSWCIPFNDTYVPQAIAGGIGVYGMPLFFVLSGFVIHYNYAVTFRTQSFGSAAQDFFAARFARIYPLYFFFLLFGSISDFVPNWIGWAPGEFQAYVIHTLTLTQSWVYRFAIHDRLVLDHGFGLAWSLSSEFFFYVAYAVAALAILRLRRRVPALVAWVGFSLIFVGILLIAYANFDAIEAAAKENLPRVLSRQESVVAIRIASAATA